MAVILVAITGFILLHKTCDKFNKLRLSLFIVLILLFLSCIIGLPKLFELVILKTAGCPHNNANNLQI